MIQKLRYQDIDQIVKLYRNELPGLMTEMGEAFLKKYYKVSLLIPDMWTYVEKQDEQILGLVSGIRSVNGLYKKIFFQDFFGFTFIFMSILITQPRLIVKIVKMMDYPGFTSDIPELLTIVVDNRYRRKGIGRKLFKRMVSEFKKNGIKEFRITAHANLPSLGFYQRVRCKKESSFNITGDELYYYKYKIR